MIYFVGVDELDDEETRILLEKEFDDFYEDQVHKSAGKKQNIIDYRYGITRKILYIYIYIYIYILKAPVVFVSKMLGMLPAIWTEEESESECKSYFNLYTFVIFAGK